MSIRVFLDQHQLRLYSHHNYCD